jgi:Cu/Zn superoxide dismutase
MWYRNPSLESILPVVFLTVVALLIMGFESAILFDSEVDTTTEDTNVQEAGAYRATLTALDDSGVKGEATFTIAESGFKVQLNARGLEPGTHPQHIHEEASCDNFGGVLLGLTPFPEATEGGTIKYQSSDLESPDNLGDRTVVVHASDGTPVACGEINPAKGNG